MSNNKIHRFDEQLEIGNRGEQLILENFHVPLELYPGRGYDFTTKRAYGPQGKQRKLAVELKTDDFNMDKTGNFFIERWSDVYRKKPGSIWQSKGKGVDWFVYYFVRNDRYFFFKDLDLLIEKVETIVRENKLGLIFVKNYGYITGGYKIPRVLLEDIYEEYEFANKRNRDKATVSRSGSTGSSGSKGKSFHPRGNGK